MKHRLFMILILATLAGSLAAQDLPILSSDAPVGAHDVLNVKVLEDASMNSQVIVSDDGQIVLNIVGKIQVAGLTSTQIEAKLENILEASYYPKATVSVQVVEFASKPISVVGAVVRPGRIGATGNTTLIQAITQAGGLTANHGKELYVLRTARNGLSEQVAINIDELMVSGNADLNIPLAPNDLVNVPIDTPITIYILGEVMKPGKVQFRSSQTPTLLQAMADAGGHTDRASRYAIIKRMVNGKEKQIEVNYRAIIAGKRADEILRDNDTVVIKQALF
ncbi:MAG TPA: polysaccharide biosynthesis/export family protein [Thermoanaerobaculia bacterium]|nr:polysaccharide biosynthesis/export family protein [Thermoanaerobaculia bacterium]